MITKVWPLPPCVWFFYLWTRSLRADSKLQNGEATRDSYLFGTLCGFAYVYMVAAWGGFVFVLNLVGLHAAFLVIIGRFSSKLHRAYTLFFVIGTAGAIQVPVVGWNPLKSFEQLGPFVVFLVFQILEYCEVQRRAKNLSLFQVFQLRVKIFAPIALALALVAKLLFDAGYFGPLSARIRGLFVQHTRTGNPLVDSVAEHQPASESSYGQYLHTSIYTLAPWGLGLSFLRWSDSNSFIIVYAIVAYYFSSKMSRLILLLGPVASVLSGVVIGFVIDQLLVHPLICLMRKLLGQEVPADVDNQSNSTKKSACASNPVESITAKVSPLAFKCYEKVYNNPVLCLLRIAGFVYLAGGYSELGDLRAKWTEFYDYSHALAKRMSNPSIMFKGTLKDGSEVLVDDYREAYWWLRDKTPEDSRVLSWWDYGYQITGIGHRTTLADGNTWNHEHIATLGYILTNTEKESHRIARHLADYVLVWAGGGGDDLAKSPHMARIGNSVYPEMCPNDPTCSNFGFYKGGIPTNSMKESLLYKLTQYGYKKDITLDENRYKHVFTSKYGKCRIFKIVNVDEESKKWVANPQNKLCDAPGSWYCSGQYPPAIQSLISRRKNFAQLEDFNVEKDDAAKKYNEEYMAKMANKPKGAAAPPSAKPPSEADKASATNAPQVMGCYGREVQFGKDRVFLMFAPASSP